jgi:hypothetical protein
MWDVFQKTALQSSYATHGRDDLNFGSRIVHPANSETSTNWIRGIYFVRQPAFGSFNFCCGFLNAHRPYLHAFFIANRCDCTRVCCFWFMNDAIMF